MKSHGKNHHEIPYKITMKSHTKSPEFHKIPIFSPYASSAINKPKPQKFNSTVVLFWSRVGNGWVHWVNYRSWDFTNKKRIFWDPGDCHDGSWCLPKKGRVAEDMIVISWMIVIPNDDLCVEILYSHYFSDAFPLCNLFQRMMWDHSHSGIVVLTGWLSQESLNVWTKGMSDRGYDYDHSDGDLGDFGF